MDLKLVPRLSLNASSFRELRVYIITLHLPVSNYANILTYLFLTVVDSDHQGNKGQNQQSNEGFSAGDAAKRFAPSFTAVLFPSSGFVHMLEVTSLV